MDELLNEITPLPWRESTNGLRVIAGEPPVKMGDPGVANVVDSDTKYVYLGLNQVDPGTRRANVRYIVRACNAYPKLLEACEAFAAVIESGGSFIHGHYDEAYAKALEAIGQAKGGS